MSGKSTKRIKVINDFLSKVLDVLCIFWVIGWIVVAVKFVVTHQPIITLSVAFLYGSPALLYLGYRYTHYYRDKWLEKKMKNNPV